MSQSKGLLFYTAATLALINALVHITSWAMAGFSSTVMPTLIGAVLWLLFAFGLKAGQRWLAYFAFLLAIVGGLFVYAQLGTNTALAQWSIIAIALLNLVLAIVLFLLIWRRPASA